jgi:hypothetical protein
VAKRSKPMTSAKPDDEWKVESDLNVLIEAEKIKADAGRHAKAQALAKRKMMDVAKVASDD